jgi:hypothetical protein
MEDNEYTNQVPKVTGVQENVHLCHHKAQRT